jgi:hypothetical protein
LATHPEFSPLRRRARRQSSTRPDDEAFAWRQFWATDGALFEPSEGHDAARELLERALEYAPDTVIGAAVDAHL